MSKICAIVVTYNRLTLLKETIEALLNSSTKVNKILVVNNASTDDTHNYLVELCMQHTTVEELLLEVNLGGSGGFFYGMKKAYELGFDFLWIMDDDTIVKPQSLSSLLLCYDKDNYGFVCSKVVWTDRELHKMNIPSLKNTSIDLNKEDSGCFEVNSCSFVSVLIKREIIDEVGYPYKDFFIWADDLEYTTRITKKGYKGLVSCAGEVIHKTPANYTVNLRNCTEKEFWKIKYGMRNRVFMHRNFGEYGAIVSYIGKNIVKSVFRKKQRFKALAMVLNAFKEGLLFQPKQE